MSFRKFKYDVTFSFAEEDDSFVREVAGHLKRTGLEYYYYKENEVAAWGTDLEKHMRGVYRRESRLCVIFISAHYREKVWTKFELRHAAARARKNIHEYVLPFKMDDTELPEIAGTIKYFSHLHYDSSRLADAIAQKVSQHRAADTMTAWLYGTLRALFSRPRHVAALIVLVLLTTLLALKDRLTPADMLAARLYEESRERVRGSICGDGMFTRSRGQGTCSSHLGILKKVDTLLPARTMEDCVEEAREISWLDD